MDMLLRWGGWVCFLVGTPINLLLLVLIHTRTSKEMHPSGRILTQAAVMDLAYVLASILRTPVFLSNGSESVIYGVGVATGDSTTSEGNREWNTGCIYSICSSVQ